jgi:hypothetical protein
MHTEFFTDTTEFLVIMILSMLLIPICLMFIFYDVPYLPLV